jgi:hypothetical protein
MPTVLRKRFIELNVQQVNLKYVEFPSITFEGYEENGTNIPVSLDNIPRNFSFKNNLADKEFIQNPNIFEKQDYLKGKNRSLDMIDKFDNEEDPFFDFDDQRSVLEKNIIDRNASQKGTIEKLSRKMSSTTAARSPKSKTYGVK